MTLPCVAAGPFNRSQPPVVVWAGMAKAPPAPTRPNSWIVGDTDIVPVDRLVHLPSNPNQGDLHAVAASFARFGQRKPLVVRRLDDDRGEIEAGNTGFDAVLLLRDLALRIHQAKGARRTQAKLDARQLLGPAAADALAATVDEHAADSWSTVAVSWVDEDPAVGLAFAATDNYTARRGSDDPDLMAALTRTVAAEHAALVDLFTDPPADDPPPKPRRPPRPAPDDATFVRTLTLPLSPADHAWATSHLGNLRRHWDLPDDPAVLLRLLEQETGSRAPGGVHLLDDDVDNLDLRFAEDHDL